MKGMTCPQARGSAGIVTSRQEACGVQPSALELAKAQGRRQHHSN